MNLQNDTKASGVFDIKIRRNGKIIDEFQSTNIVVTEGRKHMLNSTFKGTAQDSTWFIGLSGNGTTPVASLIGDTVNATLAGLNAQYSEATRPAWTATVTDNVIATTPGSEATFTMVADDTIYGAFLISESDKTGVSDTTSTVLMAASAFASSRDVKIGDEILITYQITLSSS